MTVRPHGGDRSLLVAAALSVGLAGTAHGGEERYTLAQLDGIGRALAKERCYRPVEVKTSFVRNPHDREVADEMQSFDCRAFRVAVYRSLSQSPPRELPMSVILEHAHPLANGPWSVGASAAGVRAALGPPLRVFGESLVYSLNHEHPGQDTITFEAAAGIVRAVSWTWDVD